MLLVSILEAAENTHPFVPSRLKQLDIFAKSEKYQKLMQGEFEKDALGLHEGGARITCGCGLKVNAKLSFCPECGRSLEELALPAAAPGDAPPPPPAAPPEGGSKLDKFKGAAGGFFRR